MLHILLYSLCRGDPGLGPRPPSIEAGLCSTSTSEAVILCSELVRVMMEGEAEQERSRAHTVQVQEIGGHQHLEAVLHWNLHVWHIVLVSALVPILEILDKFLKGNTTSNLLTWIVLGVELNAEDMS